ncbi:hypothetical protein GIB67_019075 [Kingdonia uniflora]|uniref:Cytochrome P450 n=1 Tax=Kingdonia uniflora TaxID=39325 RepID=A0A7J7MZJ7_9MAGN|nr:hypothetical protein GIB67_019075 [Kingdonia uniflora]
MSPLYLAFSSLYSLLALIIVFVFLIITMYVVKILVIYIKDLVILGERPPVAGTIFDQLINFDSFYDFYTFLAQKYGTCRLITPSRSEVLIFNPLNVEHVLESNASNYWEGRHGHEVTKDLFGDRKVSSYEFSTKFVRDFSNVVFKANASKLIAKVSETATSNAMIDLQEVLMKCTLDSTFKVGFGIDLNSLSGSDEVGNKFAKAFDDASLNVYSRFADPFWKIKRVLNIGSEASLRRNIKVIDDFALSLIETKRIQMKIEMDNKCAKKDLLSRFLIESETEEEKKTDRYLRDVILSIFKAGRDTTADTLTWFFYMLCKHPLVQEKVVTEVREVMQGFGNLSIDEFMELITDEALNKMPYLHAALTETLRLYPATPLVRKSAMEDDVLPDGFTIKKGDGITYTPYAMGRMKYICGGDAENFRPERWIEDGVFHRKSPFKFAAFQICLCEEFANRQMKIFSAVLLNFFKLKLVNKHNKATYRTAFTLQMDKGLHLLASHRRNVS